MRVGVIGMGWVGTSVAMALLTRGDVRELLVADLRREIAEGEAMDMAHAAPFLRTASIRSVEVPEMRSCDAVVVAAGRNGRPNESRLDLLRDNASVARGLGEELRGFAGLLVMVTNPVDVLTHVLLEASGLPPERVLGTGTLLDSARMRHVVGAKLDVAPQSVHINVLGEHGDSQVAAFAEARVGGIALRSWPRWEQSAEGELAAEVRGAARAIIARKGATNHAIGVATAYLLKWALRDERRVLTVSRLHDNVLGVENVCLSLPAVVGRRGAECVAEVALDPTESSALRRSAEILAAAKASVS